MMLYHSKKTRSGVVIMVSNYSKWKHYQSEIILLCVRWYLKYLLNYRNLEEMMREGGLHINYITIMRWVHQYGSEMENKMRKYLKPTKDFWRIDEIYIKVKEDEHIYIEQ